MKQQNILWLGHRYLDLVCVYQITFRTRRQGARQYIELYLRFS